MVSVVVKCVTNAIGDKTHGEVESGREGEAFGNLHSFAVCDTNQKTRRGKVAAVIK